MENDVEPNDEDVSRPSRRSRGHRHTTSKDTRESGESKASFFKRYRVEIFAVCLLALGIFLLVERLEIKKVMYRQMLWLAEPIKSFASFLVTTLVGVQKSDIVGLVLMVMAVCLIAWRVRFRAINRHKDVDAVAGCPNCSENLIRLPKKPIHRLLELLFQVRIRRFSCAKCAYSASTWDG